MHPEKPLHVIIPLHLPKRQWVIGLYMRARAVEIQGDHDPEREEGDLHDEEHWRDYERLGDVADEVGGGFHDRDDQADSVEDAAGDDDGEGE